MSLLIGMILGYDQIALGATAVALAASVALFIKLRRISPEERERRRREAVSRNRRSIEGLLTEASDQIIHYQYDLRGVSYFTSQDVSALRDRLPADPSRLIGPVSVRFEPNNPANSIVLSEEWSGLPALASGFAVSEMSEVSEENTRCN